MPRDVEGGQSRVDRLIVDSRVSDQIELFTGLNGQDWQGEGKINASSAVVSRSVGSSVVCGSWCVEPSWSQESVLKIQDGAFSLSRSLRVFENQSSERRFVDFGWVMICCSVAVYCCVQASRLAGRSIPSESVVQATARPIISSQPPPPWLPPDPLLPGPLCRPCHLACRLRLGELLERTQTQ